MIKTNRDMGSKDSLFHAYIGLRMDGITPEELLVLFSRNHVNVFESLFLKYWGARVLT